MRKMLLTIGSLVALASLAACDGRTELTDDGSETAMLSINGELLGGANETITLKSSRVRGGGLPREM